MTKSVIAAASLALFVSLAAGCGGSGGSGGSGTVTTASVSGKVADGYLVNATVFLDKNRNYKPDPGEPLTVTNGEGAFTLPVPQEDAGRYPLVVMAMEGKTTDLDNPGQTIANTYVMSLPASAVTTTGSVFVSPFSSLMKEKMDARPGMTLAQAAAELRTQMNIPSGVDMMSDYVRLGSNDSSDANRSVYQRMHSAARNMASLMSGEASRIMGTNGGATTVDVNRYRTMMGEMNMQLPLIATGTTRNNGVAETLDAAVNAVPPMVAGMPFRNMSSFFPPMMGVRFWNMTGHLIPSPWSGGSPGMGGRNGGGMMGGSNGSMMQN